MRRCTCAGTNGPSTRKPPSAKNRTINAFLIISCFPFLLSWGLPRALFKLLCSQTSYTLLRFHLLLLTSNEMEHGATTGGTRSFVSKPVAFQGDTLYVVHLTLHFTFETIAGDRVFGHKKVPFYAATLRMEANSRAKSRIVEHWVSSRYERLHLHRYQRARAPPVC